MTIYKFSKLLTTLYYVAIGVSTLYVPHNILFVAFEHLKIYDKDLTGMTQQRMINKHVVNTYYNNNCYYTIIKICIPCANLYLLRD